MGSAESIAALRPRLLVDWGELPQVGRAARPLFSLISDGTRGRPSIRVRVDRSLDNDPTDPLRQLRSEEPGIWTCYVPFSLTSNGLDARPGLYVIDVEVTFPHSAGGEARFLQTRIRLSIPNDGEGQRELVIDGDGQSVVNLAGHDLRSFSRVVLKGDDKSIINLQNFSQQMAERPPSNEAVVFEYELKVNHHIQQRLPQTVAVQQPSKTDALSLVIGDRRVHVIARKRVTFGRSRENDVCLRFLPRSPEHDEGSRGISRTHMSLDLTDEGLVLVDEKSAKGIDVDSDPVRDERTFSYLDAHGGRHINLPSGLASDQSLDIELMLFGHDPDDVDFRSQLEWDDVCFDTVGEPASRLWQVSRSSGIETIRMRRLTNLPQEEYVFLYRHATLGRSAKDHAVVIPGMGFSGGDLRLLYAGRMFWLHGDGQVRITVDGLPVEGACLIPLRYGQWLTIGSETVLVARMAQCELDDDPVLAAPPQPSTLAAAATVSGPAAPPLPVGLPPAPLPADRLPPPLPYMTVGSPVPPVPAMARPPQHEPPPHRPSAPAAQDPAQQALGSVALITCQVGHGSAFLAAPGLLVTNYHVIADDAIENLEAVFFDPVTHAPTSFPVALVAEDPGHDLAVLAVSATAPPLSLTRQFRHQNGHRIVIIGSPGLGYGGERLENVVTDGRLGPLYRSHTGHDRWSLSVTLNPGNSGGPVLDAATGDILGVAVAKFTTVDGLALAVPNEVLIDTLERAIRTSIDDAGRADSLHRQRYCLRGLSGFASAASAALDELTTQRDGLLGEITRDEADSLIGHRGGTLTESLVSLIDALSGDLGPQIARLSEDRWCSRATCDDLEAALGEIHDVGRLLQAATAGRLRTRQLEHAQVRLLELEPLFTALRDQLGGSLLEGKTVFDTGDPSPPATIAASPATTTGQLPVRMRYGALAELFAAPHTKPRYLTKSRFTLACSCPTKLFYTSKSGEYANGKATDPTMESLANEGNRVGALARLYFPGGVLVDTLNHDQALARTAELLSRPEVTIFEAAIRHGDLFIRADILRKTPAGIDLIEVKSKCYSQEDDGDLTTAKGIAAAWLPYVRDVAFQKHVLLHALPGTEVRAYLFLPDTSCRAASDHLAATCLAAVDDPSVSLGEEDFASPIMRIIGVDALCEQIYSDRYTLAERSLSFGDYCDVLAEHYRDDRRLQAPLSSACLTCEFDASAFALAVGEKSGKRECWQALLGWTGHDFEKPQAFEICGLSAAKKQALLDERRLHLAEVREDDIEPRDDGQPGLSQSQRQWLQVTKTVGEDGSSYLDRGNLAAEMAGWRFPLHLIDFETCRAAIPFHRGSRPSDLVAFQFSHHLMHADGTLEHAGEFLCARRGVHPHVSFVQALAEQIGRDDGTILHYAPHEISTLRSIAGQLRSRRSEIAEADELLAFIDTIAPPGDRGGLRHTVDLCRLVKRYYYAPSMRGSNSIKQVLPAVLRESELLRAKYSQPIYGSPGGIRSRNFMGIAWVTQRNGELRDPYLLLPPISGDAAANDGPAGPRLQSIRNGGAAMQAYADLVLLDWSDKRRRDVESALLRYCELDTLAMAFIVEAWREWCRQARPQGAA